MTLPETAILHYTAPPVIGGVEAVIQSHVGAFLEAGYPVTVVAGRGEAAALAPGAGWLQVPEMDSRFEPVMEVTAALEEGRVPPVFEALTGQLAGLLAPVLRGFDTLLVHNVFTKHFNLPLTAALFRLLDAGALGHCVAWCHDFTWTSPSSGDKVHPGYPWDLLRTYRQDLVYVTVSARRQAALAELLGRPRDEIRVVYNGVDPRTLLGLSEGGAALVRRLDLLAADLVLLMPVRVTEAKNIELALRVVAALKTRGCRPKLVLTGPPDPHDAQSLAYFRDLQALRAELGVQDEMRFVFESGPGGEDGWQIDVDLVGELYRACDAILMPSHREGFAMPVLEAGLLGRPVFCTNVPAAEEIGGDEVTVFGRDEGPEEVAARLWAWAEESRVHRLRRRVRQRYTWQALFAREIQPLLRGREAT
jgi:glycosyltransferase involved in cell wall biosynthesis